LNRKANT